MQEMLWAIVWVGRDKLVGRLDVPSKNTVKEVEDMLLRDGLPPVRMVEVRSMMEFNRVDQGGLGRVSAILPLDVQSGPTDSIVVKPSAISIPTGEALVKLKDAIKRAEQGEKSLRAQEAGIELVGARQMPDIRKPQ